MDANGLRAWLIIGIRTSVHFVFIVLGRHIGKALLLVKPTSEVNRPASLAAKRHCFGLFLTKLFIADWTTHGELLIANLK